MVKSLEENGELNQINQQIKKQIEEKIQMIEKALDAENFQEFEKIVTINNKNSLVSISSRHSTSHFK